MGMHTCDELTAQELHKMLKSRAVHAVQPVGNIEAHGPHLPLATDSMIAWELSLRLAQSLAEKYPEAEFLVAPVLSVGNVTDFGTRGGFSAGEALKPYLETVCENLLSAGYRKVIIINGCGGNNSQITEIAAKHKNTIYLPRWWHLQQAREVDNSYKTYIKSGGNPEDWVGTHASELETSAIMAIEEKLQKAFVRKENIKNAFGPNTGFAVIPAMKEGRLHEIAPAGVLGDARGATAEKGRKLFDIVVGEYLRILAEEFKR